MPLGVDLEKILEMSNEETSIGSFNAIHPFRNSRESLRASIEDPYEGRRPSKLNRSRRSRHKPSYAGGFEEIPETENSDQDDEGAIEIKENSIRNTLANSMRNSKVNASNSHASDSVIRSTEIPKGSLDQPLLAGKTKDNQKNRNASEHDFRLMNNLKETNRQSRKNILMRPASRRLKRSKSFEENMLGDPLLS